MASSSQFYGKLIAITRAGSGISRATAKLLHARGAQISPADTSAEGLDATVHEIRGSKDDGRIMTKIADVRKSSEVESWMQETVAWGGKGTLVGAANIAGISEGRRYKMTEVDDDVFPNILDVNLTGVMRCMREELKQICDQGSIVNIASLAGLIASPFTPAYTASKHGVVGLTRVAAKAPENAARRIRINANCPAAIDTGMVTRADAIGKGVNNDHSALKRRGTAEGVASMVAFMPSDESTFSTGTAIPL